MARRMTRTGVSGVILAAVLVICFRSLPALISARECTSIDVRNNVANLNQLEGCTVVKGSLLIVLLVKNVSVSDYDNMTFPELREITDFFILFDVKGLISFRKLLPNLTVIRGRRLFLNYAMAVSNMPDLTLFEFNSLVAIQRGHVYVGNCPKLCFLKKVNWDRLTLSPGENHIIPMTEANCASNICMGCDSGYCWSNKVCQKFENDNLANLARGPSSCHPECLGGCYNTTNIGCIVCKGITHHGACVDKCPSDLYYSEHHLRCYTKEECGAVRGYVHGNECTRHCPDGYIGSRKQFECIKCATECISVCQLPDGFVIYNLAAAESLMGCSRLNGSLNIEFRNKIDEKDLMRAFASVHEVQGHIKIMSSPYLKSLAFLRNLEKVHGEPLENKTFALILYNNDNLQELWSPTDGKTLELVNGGIYAYSNIKLCNSVVREFAHKVIHDKEKDLLELNDQEVLCDPARLLVEVSLVSQNSTTISWARNQTAEEVEVIYRESKYNKGEHSEEDDHVCLRIIWKRDLLFIADISHNVSHYSYKITGLKPYTVYEVLVKTFHSKNGYSARSTLQVFTTAPDYPTAPKLTTLAKETDSITIGWTQRNKIKEVVTYYWLETFEHTVDLEIIDTRNFCERPSETFRVSSLDDYDNCCSRRQQAKLDDQFRHDMEATFPCSLYTKENCHNMVTYGLRANTARIDVQLQNYTKTGLKPSILYTFFIYACNDIGCGTYYMYSDKTNFSLKTDEVDKVEACRIPETNEYHVKFEEPKNPNGAIVSYTIHFQKRQHIDAVLYQVHLNCITRKQHEMANFRYVTVLNFTYEQVAVRTKSLAGNAISKWVDIENCQKFESEQGISATGVFMICCLTCTITAVAWLTVRRQWWRRINFNFRRVRDNDIGTVRFEDEQVLVASFDSVSLHNSADEQ